MARRRRRKMRSCCPGRCLIEGRRGAPLRVLCLTSVLRKLHRLCFFTKGRMNPSRIKSIIQRIRCLAFLSVALLNLYYKYFAWTPEILIECGCKRFKKKMKIRVEINSSPLHFEVLHSMFAVSSDYVVTRTTFPKKLPMIRP